MTPVARRDGIRPAALRCWILGGRDRWARRDCEVFIAVAYRNRTARRSVPTSESRMQADVEINRSLVSAYPVVRSLKKPPCEKRGGFFAMLEGQARPEGNGRLRVWGGWLRRWRGRLAPFFKPTCGTPVPLQSVYFADAVLVTSFTAAVDSSLTTVSTDF